MTASKDLEQKLGDMVAGFDTLVAEMEALRANNRALQKQLYSTEKQPNTPAATENGEDRDKSTVSSGLSGLASDHLSLEKAREVATQWRASHRPAPPKIELPEGHPEVEFEQDFTTPGGTQGQLGCPFAAMMTENADEKNSSEIKMGRKGRRPGEPSLTASSRDPIAAEFHSNSAKSQKSHKSHTTTTSGQAPKCPIRFLDQHKPEEVAQYFQNHKHEIPRSHEICIKRYQGNEQSVRQLDAKYGSLVNMIQGLGKKHQPMLEEKEDEDEDEEADEDDAVSQAMSDKDIAKIQKWAGNVGSVPVAEPLLEEQLEKRNSIDKGDDDESSRKPRFERDLREVRLGESPSRPWGIHVPANVMKKAEAASATPTPDVPSAPGLKGTEAAATGSKFPAAATSMTFNGPVFFGYSAEEMARLLQQVPELRNVCK